MGVNQSTQLQANNQENSFSHGITVVNPIPGQDGEDEKITLPARVPPILPIEGNKAAINSSRHGAEVNLDHQIWIDFVSTIDKYSNSRAELIATRQSQLQEKLMIVDEHVQRFTDSYINDSHKALARMNEDCRKMGDINKLLQKCTVQSEVCIDMLEKLNFILPVEHRLEPIEI